MSPSSSARVAMAMSADRGCSIEHIIGYRGGGRLSRGKGEPMVGVGYRGNKGPGQRKDMGEAKPTDPEPTPQCHLPFFPGPFCISSWVFKAQDKPLSTFLLWAFATPRPQPPCGLCPPPKPWSFPLSLIFSCVCPPSPGATQSLKD